MVTVTTKINGLSFNDILQDTGLNQNGNVQAFYTGTVLKNIIPYMPMQTGSLIKKMIAQTEISSGLINLSDDSVLYLYYGVAMEGNPRVPTDRPLHYTKNLNALAGSKWVERMVTEKGDVILQEVKNKYGFR